MEFIELIGLVKFFELIRLTGLIARVKFAAPRLNRKKGLTGQADFCVKFNG